MQGSEDARSGRFDRLKGAILSIPHKWRAVSRGTLPLTVKCALYLTVALSAAMLLFTALVAWYQRNQALDQLSDSVTQLSEVIAKSTRYAMLQNQPEYVDRIIQDVGNQADIYRVRIFSLDGRITHSTSADEVGRILDRSSEACARCHQGGKATADVLEGKRTWTFTYSSPEGQRLLGSMEVIRNEPSCYTAACHHHSPSTSVNGILDIVYSLDNIDRRIEMGVVRIAGFSAAFITIVSLFVGFLAHRVIYLPLRDLGAGAKRLAAGDFGQPIPVRSEDEFGKLATSFNAMTAALQRSQSELRDWAHKLEQRVQARTTELRVAQAEVARASRATTMGAMAASIAHEINQPLAAIVLSGNAGLRWLARATPDLEEARAALKRIVDEGHRAGKVIGSVRAMFKQGAQERAAVNVNELIGEILALLHGEVHTHDISVETDLADNLPSVIADRVQLQQVLLNLIMNAIEAMSAVTERRRVLRLRTELHEPNNVVIAVEDSGPGIDRNVVDRIFEPFFTTKSQGMGMGLSICRSIIEAHDGRLWFEPAVPQGTIFFVNLPAAATNGK